MGGILRFGKQLAGYDRVRVDGPEWNLKTAGNDPAPALRFAAGIFVANQHGSIHFFQQFFE